MNETKAKKMNQDMTVEQKKLFQSVLDQYEDLFLVGTTTDPYVNYLIDQYFDYEFAESSYDEAFYKQEIDIWRKSGGEFIDETIESNKE